MRAKTRGVRVFSRLLAVALAGAAGLAYQPGLAVPSSPDDRTILHVLNRIGFGPRPGDVERVRAAGLRAYIEEQLHPERLPDADMGARLEGLTTITKSTQELAADYFIPALQMRREQQRRAASRDTAKDPETPAPRREQLTPEQRAALRAQQTVLAELAQQKILRAAYSERQLQEVMVDFWFNHFNVFSGKGLTRLYLTAYERDAIRPHALGRFRDLLGATAASPAMLVYLDNWQSAANEGAATMARLPSSAQNRRPRGLNENYARELMELHTLGVDGSYTQKDVQEVARAFTGWTITAPRRGGSFRFEPRMHDDGEKVVLGHRLTAGGGKRDGERVLDLLAKHPSTATFVATKLARRFVADEPPTALVDRAANVFRRTDGDIREVVRTIVTSPEFFDEASYRAKVKTPFEFVVSAVRATGADAASALPLVQTLRHLGMPLYGCQPPTGYADTAEAWVNTGALLSRMNFAVALAEGRLRAVRIPPASFGPSTDEARSTLAKVALAGDLSESTTTTVEKAEATPQALALLLGAPEFQRR